MPIAKVKKERRCDGEGRMEKNRGLFCVVPLGTLCTPTHLL